MSTDMTPAALERLSMLIEECAEVIKAGAVAVRRGYDRPVDWAGRDGKFALQQALGDLNAAIMVMMVAGDVDQPQVETHAMQRLSTLPRLVKAPENVALLCSIASAGVVSSTGAYIPGSEPRSESDRRLSDIGIGDVERRPQYPGRECGA